MLKTLKNNIGLFALIAFVSVALLVLVPYLSIDKSSTSQGAPAPRDDNRLASRLGQTCVPVHTTVSIGNQATTEVLAANKFRAWAIIQQAARATNTTSILLGGDAVSGEGYTLGSTTNNITPHYPLEFELGIQVNRPATTTVDAITNEASTTVNVIECTYD